MEASPGDTGVVEPKRAQIWVMGQAFQPGVGDSRVVEGQELQVFERF